MRGARVSAQAMRFVELSDRASSICTRIALKPTMATDLQGGERSRSEGLNSCAGADDVNHVSQPGTTCEAVMSTAFVEAAQWGGPETILLVEDEAFVRTATAEVLESAGYRLVIARSAAEAFEAYRRCSWQVDLLLCDIVMPGMSGRELATALENFYPRARVLLMSGYAEQLAWCGSSACGNQFLAKPFSTPMLLRRVREVLDKPVDSGERAKSRVPCGSAWLAESHGKSEIEAQPGRGSPSPRKREACRRPYNSPRPGQL
jgi:CheY-like chemotaxis protein